MAGIGKGDETIFSFVKKIARKGGGWGDKNVVRGEDRGESRQLHYFPIFNYVTRKSFLRNLTAFLGDKKMKNRINLLEKISGYDIFSDGYIELVTDYTTSRYFGHNQVEEAMKFAAEMSQAGKEVHFGPAVRKEDLGVKRSDRTNVLWTKTCWVDIDSPDKKLSAEDKLKAAEKLKNDFIQGLKSYNLEPSFIVCSGHGFHFYFVLQRVNLDTAQWAPIQAALIAMGKGDSQAKDVGRLLRVPGTVNWKDRKNPKNVEIIYESDRVYLEKDFLQLVKDYGPKSAPVTMTSGNKNPLGFIPPCIGHFLDHNTKIELGHRHQVRIVVATFGYHEGWALEDTIQKLKHLTDDPKKSEDDVRGVYEVLQRDFQRYNVGCGDGSNLKVLVDSGITFCDKDKCQFGKPPVQSAPAAPEKLDIVNQPTSLDLSIWFSMIKGKSLIW